MVAAQVDDQPTRAAQRFQGLREALVYRQEEGIELTKANIVGKTLSISSNT